jgi:hypothetical protein
MARLFDVGVAGNAKLNFSIAHPYSRDAKAIYNDIQR